MARAGVGFADRKLTTLSGGELQRVQLAIALAQDAPALIADEPTSSLDLGATSAIARLLRGLADDGLAVVLVVHDLALAAAVADEVVVVSGGRTVAAGPPATCSPRRCCPSLARRRRPRQRDGRTALHVDWLGAGPPPSPFHCLNQELLFMIRRSVLCCCIVGAIALPAGASAATPAGSGTSVLTLQTAALGVQGITTSAVAPAKAKGSKFTFPVNTATVGTAATLGHAGR